MGLFQVLVRFVSATSVVAVEPQNVSALGHLPLTVAGANLGADVRYCIFGEGERVIEVPVASLASEREVVCPWPQPRRSMNRANDIIVIIKLYSVMLIIVDYSYKL